MATSVNDFGFDNEFSFYPNPTSSKIIFKNVNQRELETIIIYNTLGQSIHPFQITTNQIDVSNFQKGIYFISLRNSIKKLIIE